jgi:hypothetical protein
MNKEISMTEELNAVLKSGKLRPYIFRTRLERALIRISTFTNSSNETILKEEVITMCEAIREKIRYISDKSNQSPDGTLNSFNYLEGDIRKLAQLIH